jgi:hypothetical protein
MKYSRIILIVLILFLSVGSAQDKNECSRTLVQLAHQFIGAIKDKNLVKFKECWVTPEIAVAHFSRYKSVDPQEKLKIIEYITDVNLKVEEYFSDFQNQINEANFKNQDIIYLSMSAEVRDKFETGCRIPSMHIEFTFKDLGREYQIMIDDG